MAFTTVPVSGTVKEPDGSAAAGAIVTFTLNTPMSDGTLLVSTEPVAVTCDASGAFTQNLYANDDASTSPSGTYYTVKVQPAGKNWLTIGEPFSVSVPSADVAGVDVFSLAKLVNPSTLTATAPLGVGDAVTGATASSLVVTDASGKLQSGPATSSVENMTQGQGPWLRAPYQWNATWLAAKAAAGSAQARIAFIGDSITAGQNSGDFINNSLPGKLKAALATAGNSMNGDFWPAWVYNTATNPALTGTALYSTPPAASTFEGGYGRTIAADPSVTDFTTFTSPYACTAMDIIYVDYNATTFTYQLDGGSPVTVTCTNNGTQANAQVKKISLTGLTLGTHTIQFNSSSGSNSLLLVGVSTYTSTTGIVIAREGYSSMRMVDLATAAGSNTGAGSTVSFPPDKISLWQGQTPGGANATSPTGFGFPTQPHLAIVGFSGINDTTYGIDLLAYENALRRLIQALRRGVQNCSILIWAPYYPDGVNSDTSTGSFYAQNYQRYKKSAASIADANQCAFLDIDMKWSETAGGQGFVSGTDIHPLAAGYADIANQIIGVI